MSSEQISASVRGGVFVWIAVLFGLALIGIVIIVAVVFSGAIDVSF
jgi:flagellar basal body-associated protein FliL